MNEQKPLPVVYIAGTSFSGSSILGYLLGSSPFVHNVGELKFFNRMQATKWKALQCSCGQVIATCPFWGPFTARSYGVFEMPSFWQKAKAAGKILFGSIGQANSAVCADDQRLLADLLTEVRHRQPATRYLLDTSKSIWRLQHLRQCQGIDLKVVYIRRGIKGNVASFKGHNEGFWLGLLIYLVSHPVMERFLKRSQLPTVWVSYDELAADTPGTLRRIGDFLGVDYSRYEDDLKRREFHVAWGNFGVQKQFIEGFSGVRRDDSWQKRLTPFERFILNRLDRAK
jgi:hypothetical protein